MDASPDPVLDRRLGRRYRWLAAGGMVGPAAFVAAWAVGGAVRSGYSPTGQAISRLAEVGASTRPLMTAGFVTFGVAVPAYSLALRRALGGPAWLTAATSGVATLAVAAFPLDAGSDLAHAVAATVGSAALAATPLAASAGLRSVGLPRTAAASAATGALSAAFLLTMAFADRHGLWQRLGLTVADAWLAASAAVLVGRGRFGAAPSSRRGSAR